MKKGLGFLFGLIAILIGLFSIFKFTLDMELAIGFITFSLGILAIIWTSMAVISLSKGSALRKHTTNFLLCLIFILAFSIWHVISKLFGWRQTINQAMLYPGYLFLALTFVIFVVTAYQIRAMGQEFGFKTQAKKIKKVMQKKKS